MKGHLPIRRKGSIRSMRRESHKYRKKIDAYRLPQDLRERFKFKVPGIGKFAGKSLPLLDPASWGLRQRQWLYNIVELEKVCPRAFESYFFNTLPLLGRGKEGEVRKLHLEETFYSYLGIPWKDLAIKKFHKGSKTTPENQARTLHGLNTMYSYLAKNNFLPGFEAIERPGKERNPIFYSLFSEILSDIFGEEGFKYVPELISKEGETKKARPYLIYRSPTASFAVFIPEVIAYKGNFLVMPYLGYSGLVRGDKLPGHLKEDVQICLHVLGQTVLSMKSRLIKHFEKAGIQYPSQDFHLRNVIALVRKNKVEKINIIDQFTRKNVSSKFNKGSMRRIGRTGPSTE